jgi:hypothetical protein
MSTLPRIDLTGQRFGKWTVIQYSHQHSKSKRHYWTAQCDCGTLRAIGASSLTCDRTHSCGCDRGSHLKTHDMSRHPDYQLWLGMWNRVNNPNGEDWELYGGRGITACERWKWFPNFVEDMGPRTSKTQTIERRDVNGNYEPSNCYWLENRKQALNTRRNISVTIDGETKCLMEWSRQMGISESMVRSRVRHNNMTYQEALIIPCGKIVRRNSRMITIGSVTKCLAEWIREYNAPESLVRSRINRGWEPLKALTTPSTAPVSV